MIKDVYTDVAYYYSWIQDPVAIFPAPTPIPTPTPATAAPTPTASFATPQPTPAPRTPSPTPSPTAEECWLSQLCSSVSQEIVKMRNYIWGAPN